MSDITLDTARARYLADVQRVHPLFQEQITEIVQLLDVLLGEHNARVADPLEHTRAAYLARLRERCRTLDEQVLELAKAGAHLFAPSIGISAAA